jgi:hypothetical protein
MKETLQIHIQEEENLQQIKLKTIRSDHYSLIVALSSYFVHTTYSLKSD